MDHHAVSMDSGADTCILGQEQHVAEKYPTRRFSVVGFDKEPTTKNILPVVTLMAMFECPTGECVLLQCNEAVHNKTAAHSGMSAYQIGK